MPFPYSASGSFRLDAPSDTDEYVAPVRGAICSWLKDRRARVYVDENRIIRFEAGVFRLVTSLNILVQIRSGDVTVTAEPDVILVSYRFWYTEMLGLVTFGVLVFFGPDLFDAPNLTTFDAYGLLLLFWTLLFVPNFLISRFLVPTRLKEVGQRAIRGRTSASKFE